MMDAADLEVHRESCVVLPNSSRSYHGRSAAACRHANLIPRLEQPLALLLSPMTLPEHSPEQVYATFKGPSLGSKPHR